jgi:hypothetical protein
MEKKDENLEYEEEVAELNSHLNDFESRLKQNNDLFEIKIQEVIIIKKEIEKCEKEQEALQLGKK